MKNIEVVEQYFKYGFSHVVPLGFDHILFILSIFFLTSNLRLVLIQCSVFTLAHSISLGLASANLLFPDPKVIEPLISFSIVITAVGNIISDEVKNSRLVIIFLFGLIHGMGFASALKEIGIPQNNFFIAVLFFNIGVELGQVFVILLAYFLITKWVSKKTWYKSRIVYPLSSLIACIAMYLTFVRMFH